MSAALTIAGVSIVVWPAPVLAAGAASTFTATCAATPAVFISNQTATVLDQGTQGTSGLTYSAVGSASGWDYNALAMNPLDDSMVAISQNINSATFPAGHLLAIASDGSVTDKGAITGVAAQDVTAGVTSGAFDLSGNYWFASAAAVNNGTGKLYQLNLTTLVATPLASQSALVNANDLTYASGFLWGIGNNTNTIQRVNLTTGQVSGFTVGFLPASGLYGSAWTYGNGNPVFALNTGTAYQVAIATPSATPTFTLVSQVAIPSSPNNDATACPTPQPVDLQIAKTGPVSAAGGAAVSWTLTVTNNSSAASSGFVVNDTVPAAITSVASPTAGCTVSGNTVTCIGAALAAGASATITITGNTPATFTSAITNTATVTGNEQDPVASNNSSSQTISPASTFDCTGGTIYTLQRTATTTSNSANGLIYGINTNGLGSTVTDTLFATLPTGSGFVNGLGIGNGGTSAWAVSQSPTSGTNVTIYGYSSATRAWTTYTGSGAAGTSIVAGAVDPANGIYYYATYPTTSNNGLITIFGFNTNTDTAIPGVIATTTVPINGVLNANGDFTFDSVGNLYIVSTETTAAGVGIISAPLPTVGSANGVTLTDTLLSTIPNAAANTFNGAAFDNYGHLYVQYASGGTSTLLELNPNTAATIAGPATQSTTVNPDVDLAACSQNPTLSLQKNIAVGRVGSTDQFGLSITGTGIASGNTATTSGTSLGLQGVTAGPILGLSGATYTLAETATNGNLSSYVSTYTCVNQTDGNSVVASGTATSFNLTMPNPPTGETGPYVVCTFTNSPRPTLALTKALSGSRVNSGDQFTVAIHTGSAAGPVVNATTNSTTTGTGSTVTNGSGTTGTFSATAGTTYYLTEAGANGALLTDYSNEAITCTDTNGLQTGLPTAAPFAGSLAITPVAGAAISCTLTNTANIDALTLTKTANPTTITAAGQNVAYSFLVKNTGNVTLTGLAIADTFTAPAGPTPTITCPVTTLAPGATTTCTATYTSTQADIDNGSINNSATVSGKDPSNRTVTSTPSIASVTATQTGALTIVKTANPTTVSSAGTLITYTFLVTNTGNTTLTNVAVTDTQTAPAGALTSGPTCPAGAASLAPGASVTCTATYTTTQTDITNGTIKDTATATGKDPKNNTITSAPSTATVTALLSCVAPTLYSTDGSNQLDVLSTTSPTASKIATFGGQVNALGITAGGTNAYAVQGAYSTTGQVMTIARYNATTGAVTTYTGATVAHDIGGSFQIFRGGLNPANSIFYYSEQTSTGSQDVYAFDTNTNTNIGYVGAFTGFSGGSGDLAFDRNGTMYIVVSNGGSGSQLLRVQNLPTTAGSATLAPTVVATLPTGPAYGGFAFGGDGYLYASAGSTLYKINPTTGAQVSTQTIGGNAPNDLASCAVPAEITLEKNITARAGGSDQFGLSITGGGISGGNTATTTGATTGPQTATGEIAGPVLVLPATTYTLTETAASGTLNSYTGSISCVDTANGNATVPTTPSGAGVWTATVPTPTGAQSLPALVCTITNTPQQSITLNKVLSGGRVNSGDQFTVAIHTGSAAGPVVNATTNSTTTGTGATVTPGSGTTGTYLATAATTYYLTEAGANGALLTDYSNEAITCIDTNGLQTGLPTAAPFAGSLAITPVAGAAISCTLTNTANIDALTLTKTASPTTITAAGQNVTYSFLVKNTGNVTLTGLAIADTLTAPAGPALSITCPVTTLAPTATTTCTATYTTTQADIDNGSINNTATASGKDPSNRTVTSAPSTAAVTATQTGALTIVKTASPTTVSSAGTVITYTFLVTNTGNVTLTNAAVNDTQTAPAGALTTGPTCPAGAASLAPGASVTCTATYTVTQTDITNGTIKDTATATAKDPKNNTVTSAPATATVTATQTPQLTLVKSAAPATVTAAGQSVTYSFKVTNSGNLPVTSLSIADTFAAPAGPALSITCPVTALAPGVSTTCTATYLATQADIDNGSINNTATANATDSNGHAVASPASIATVTATQTSGLTLTKSASPATIAAAGQTVAYSFLVTNSGDVTITNLAIADTFTAPAGPVPTITCPVTTLAPGASTTCTASYLAKQADVDNGTIKNSATAAGKNPAGTTVTSNASTATVNVTRSPKLTLVKAAAPTSVTTAGTTITYTFTVTNSGNETMTGLAINDTFTAPAGPVPTITCLATSLAPGASTTCSATYAATQADVDNGSINNSATATATDPTNATTTSNPSTAAVSVPSGASLSLVKAANPTTITAAGQTVAYTFAVTNNGNVTITSLSIADSFSAPAGPALTITCPTTTLAPGANTTCTATYTATQSDVDKGTIKNSATANGLDPKGNPVASPQSTATVTATQSAGLTVVKSATPTTVNGVGQTVTYSFVAKNTGNVTLTGLSINDTLSAPAGPPLTINCPTTTLAPGASTTCTALYSTIQADLDHGSINNSATATAKDPNNATVTSAPSTATVTATQSGALTIVKSATPTAISAAGQTVSYSFLVTNTGNVTITSLAVADSFTAPAGPALIVTCPTTTLAPGANTTCTATYTSTQADVDKGTIKNTATASGKDPANATVTSAPSTATVTVNQSPKLTVTKTANPTTVGAAGATVTYTFAVRNTGNVTISSLAIADSFTAPAGPVPTMACVATTLAPGAATTCTSAAYTVTQADVDNGSITDTATASGTDPNSNPVSSAPSSATVNINQVSALTLVKSANPTSVTSAGQTVTYSFAVTNTGNLPITGLSIADTLTAPAGPALTISCPVTTLAPNAAATCAATYTATQADVDNGIIKNTATANGTDSNGHAVASNASNATVTAAATPSLSLVKSANPTSVTGANQGITYSFAVTNTGNVTINNLTITDTFTAPAGPLPTVTCPVTTLAPGASTTCTAPYTTTTADADNGTVKNSATASGTDPKGNAVSSPPSSVTVTIPETAGLTLAKSVTPATAAVAGQTLNYSFAVTNTGNVTLSLLSIADSLTAPAGPALTVSCPSTTLAAGASTTCTASYTVTQSDVDHGSVLNSATANATDPHGSPITSPPSTATATITPTPGLSIVKTANPTSVSAVGQTVNYSFAVTNTGNVTITGLAIADTLMPPAGPALTITCPTTTLTPGAVTTCTATYTTTQADIDNGSIENSATVHGLDPTGHAVTSPPSTATVAVNQTPALSVAKTASPATVTAAGQTVTYSFAVSNTGNVTVSGLAINDTFTAPAGPALTITCPTTTLAPGAGTTCTATYTTTQADINNGSIKNSATAGSTSPAGPVTSPPSIATVAVTQTPKLALVKTANPTSITSAGQTVTYSFAVTNSGNVTITGLSIADALTAPAGPALTVSCPTTTLAPGAGAICTATYTATQADVDNGSINNTATATRTGAGGQSVTSAPSSATVPVTAAPTLTLTKSAAPTSLTKAGQSVTYSFIVKNTGNVTVSSLAINDSFTAPAGPPLSVTCPTTTLAPNATTTCTAVYTATQADVDHGGIDNSATATAKDPGNNPVTSPISTAHVTITPAPALTVTKSANPTTVTTAGQSVAYSFLVKNTGTVTLSSIAVTDTLTAPAGPALVVTCPVTTLAPGGTTTCTATYTVTQNDVNNGAINNSATATGTPPTGAPVTSPPSTATVTATQSTGLTLTKTANPTSVTTAGQTVTYSFAVANTGNTTLSSLSIADTLTAPAGPALTVTCPTTTLAPGTGTTCTATYTVTQADLDNGTVKNTAVANASDPSSQPVTSPPSTATVTAATAPALTIVKSANPTTVTTAGSTIAYSFVVTNSGDVTVHGLSVADVLTAPAGPALTVACPTTTLAPGASVTCTASYTTTQADIDHGTVKNSATADGLDPHGNAVASTPSTATVTATPAPAVTVTKSASPIAISTAGQTVTYSFLAKNSGNVTLTGLSINDILTAPAGPALTVSCPTTTLAPGATTTCTATYAATQADVDNGSINNSATVSGHTPGGSTVTSPPSTATVTAAAAPALTVTKTASPTSVTSVGQQVAYSFVVTNTGNVTVNALAINDTFTAPAGPALTVSCPTTTLAPGASTTCTANYATTQADLDKGSIKNSATASGTPVGGGSVTSPPSSVTVNVPETSSMTIVKSASPTTASAAGQTVTYSFLVTNTGNVTMSSITVNDTLTAPAGPALTVTCPGPTLAPGAAVTCTATYAATQADIDKGSINNSATATGTDPHGTTTTTPPSTATVVATAAAALQLTKSVARIAVSGAGQHVTYSFLVKNTGNVTVNTLAINDSLTPPAGPALTITCPTTLLAPGATTTCSAPYTTTQADANAGQVLNTATAAGLDPTGAAVTSNNSTATLTITPAPALNLIKSAAPATVTAVGQTVTYTFALHNTGNVTLTAISVADSFTAPAGPGGAITCAATTLAPGATTTCTSTYSVTQADLDNGSISNTATAASTAPDGSAVPSNPSSASVSVAAAPKLTITKSASPTRVNNPGDTITYSFAVTNSGNVTVTNLAIVDTFTAPAGPGSAITCPVTTLAPGAATTCTSTYAITLADVVQGRIDNSATAGGTDPQGTAVTSLPSTATVNVTQKPELNVVKTAAPVVITAAGQVVDYTFVVTNTGNLPVSGITVDDTFVAPAGPALSISCPASALLPNVSMACTGSYTATQADVDNGVISNAATVTGTGSNGTSVTSPPSTATVTANPAPALTLVKSGTPTTISQPGQTVTYSFVVTNSGNTTVHGLVINDSFDSPAGPGSAITCPSTTLAPRASTTCTSTYVATQADVDQGTIKNTATASGTDASGHPVTSGPSSFTVTIAAAPALTLVKSATTAGLLTAPGQTVDYRFAVTNNGNVTLTLLQIVDALTAPAAPALTVTCPVLTVAPTATVVCTATYTLTQADVDNGSVNNTATATAHTPTGTTITSAPSTATVAIGQTPALTIAKSVNPTTVSAVGTVVAVSFVVTNSGNTTVTALSVADTQAAPAGPLDAPPACPATTLAPGASVTCTATYTTTQADLDHGSINDSAVASGRNPSGTTVTSPPATATVTVAQHPALTLAKAANPTTVAHVGDLITYTFTVTNSGNVTISTIAVADTQAAPAAALTSAPTCPAGPLAPGAVTTCTATYTATQADLDHASIADSAVASGLDPAGHVTTSPPATALVSVTSAPALTVVKSAAPASVSTVGSTVTYTFVVTNSGNVTLHAVSIADVQTAATGTLASGPTCPAGPLTPGASTTCTATYVVAQGDLDRGHIADSATATATPPTGAPVTSPPSTATVTATQHPALSLAKSANPIAVSSVGSVVTYSFVVTNTGNVTVSTVSITDTQTAPAGALTSGPTCPAAAASLAPGASVTCTATYTVAQADLDNGSISDSALASGADPSGAPVASPPSTAVVAAQATPALSLVKAGIAHDDNGDGFVDLGDSVTWTFTVTNNGNVTLHAVTVNDPAAGAITCPAGNLPPGASVTCTSVTPHPITQTDVDAGRIVNTASATADPPGSTVPVGSNQATATVPINQVSKLGLAKRATTTDTNGDGVVDAGDEVRWTIVATNLGTTTITDLVVVDPTAGTVTCPVTTLAPGASTDCTTTGRPLTATDAAAGFVTNVATASGTGIAGQVVSPQATATVLLKSGLAYTGVPGLTADLTGGVGLVLLGLLALVGAARRRRRHEA